MTRKPNRPLPVIPKPDDAPKDAPEPSRPSQLGDHEGGDEDEIGDRTGPAAGYDEEPAQVKDRGGVL